MKVCIVAIRDSAMASFAAPMAFPTRAVAIRQFVQQVNSGDTQSQLVNTPQDFELWHIADYQDETGEFSVPERGRECLSRGADVKQG